MLKPSLVLAGSALLACTSERAPSRPAAARPLDATDLAAAYGVALRGERETIGPVVALSPIAARPDSEVVQPAGVPDTVPLDAAVLRALRARPEVAGICDIVDAGVELASYCDTHQKPAPHLRYAVRVTPPELVDSATAVFSVWYIRVRAPEDTTRFAPGFAFSINYRMIRRDTTWFLVRRQPLSIT